MLSSIAWTIACIPVLHYVFPTTDPSNPPPQPSQDSRPSSRSILSSDFTWSPPNASHRTHHTAFKVTFLIPKKGTKNCHMKGFKTSQKNALEIRVPHSGNLEIAGGHQFPKRPFNTGVVRVRLPQRRRVHDMAFDIDSKSLGKLP